jgi:hypothetical protein
MEVVLSEGKFSISQTEFRCKYHSSILVFIPLFLILLLREQHLGTFNVFRLGLPLVLTIETIPLNNTTEHLEVKQLHFYLTWLCSGS